MIDRYGTETDMILHMNQIVDKEAQAAVSKQERATPVACKYQPRYSVTNGKNETLLPLTKHVKQALAKRKKTKYKGMYPQNNKISTKVDTSVTKHVFSKTFPHYNAAQNYLFKIRYHKLRTKTNVIQDATKYKMTTPLNQHYSNDKCPMCKQTTDSTTHHIKCPTTENIAKQLPRSILRIVNKYLSKAKKNKIKFFPAWYWVHDTSAQEDPSVKISEEEKEMAHLPAQIKRKLQLLGISTEDNIKCRTEMQLAVANNFHRRWLFRCQYMFSKYNQQPST